jgi:ketosteroid isomerase-like protein
MTASERIVRRFYDRFNAGDVDGAAEQYAEDCEWDFPAFGTVCRTRQEVLDVCRGWKAAFPDGRVEVINAIVCDDTVVVEWDSHGTWTGPLGAAAGEPKRSALRTTRLCHSGSAGRQDRPLPRLLRPSEHVRAAWPHASRHHLTNGRPQHAARLC